MPANPLQGRLFVFGDLHGHINKLEALLKQIRTVFRPDKDKYVFVGDYIDKGPDSKKVVQRLLELSYSGVKTVFLVGNHESMLLDDYLSGKRPHFFLNNGGLSTLKSYGLHKTKPKDTRFPPEHMKFFNNLRLYYRESGYLFVHAGLRPGIPLKQQSVHDLLWIREEFYEQDHDWEDWIIFGHTPFHNPFLKGKLIGIDTGVEFGGPLTCLVLPDMMVLQE